MGVHPMVGVSGLLYTIPSLALFVALPGIIGTKILDPVNVVVALTLYTVALLVLTVADGSEPSRRTSRPRRPRWCSPAHPPRAVGGAADRDPAHRRGPARRRRVQCQPRSASDALLGVPQLGLVFTSGFQLFYYIRTGGVGAVPAAGIPAPPAHPAGRPAADAVDPAGALVIGQVLQWLTDRALDGPARRAGRTVEHIAYSSSRSRSPAASPSRPGMWIGHTVRGRSSSRGSPTACGALPTLGLLILAVLLIAPPISIDLAFSFPSLIALVVLGGPPVLSRHALGIQNGTRRRGTPRTAWASPIARCCGGWSCRAPCRWCSPASELAAADHRHGDDRGVNLARRALPVLLAGQAQQLPRSPARSSWPPPCSWPAW